jgi:electron transport complex protein RnfG
MAGDDGNPIGTVLLVGAVAAGAAFIVSLSHDFSKDRIAANERARLLESLNSVLDPALHDRDLQTVRLTATDPDLLGDDEPVDVFVALDGTQAVATVFASVAPHGYNAPIRLLIGISPDATVTGVRAVRHRETPGLGDRIEIAKSNWIRQFDAKSLQMPPLAAWSIVEEEKGAFDALTGATVTSRAVVNAVKGTLLYFEQHRDELYASARQTLQATDAATE